MTQQEVIKTFMATLDNTTLKGTAALNAAVKSCSDFKSVKAVINQMISDCKNASSANAFLQDYCGIILSNADTGAITGKDAGGDTVKTADSIVPEEGDLISYTKNSFTTNGVTFKLAKDFSSLTKAQKYMWQGLYTWWAKNSLDLISDSYGKNYGFDENSSAVTKTIEIKFEDIGTSGVAITEHDDDKITLTINLNYYSDIDTTDPNGSSSTEGAFYLDRTLAHELTHAVMMANVLNYDDLPQFIKEGIAELTHGIDDTRRARIRAVANNSDSLKSALDLTDTSTGSNNSYAAGFMFMRYLAKQSSDPLPIFTQGDDYYINYTSNTVLSALGGNDTVYNYGESAFVKGNGDDDYIVSQITSVTPTLFGGAGNDTVMSFVRDSSLAGGDGDDYIYSGYGYISGTVASDSSGDNNTIKAGRGNDTIYLANGSTNNIVQYMPSDGNDIIYGFDSDDTLHIAYGKYSTSKSGDNVIVKVGSSKITLASAADETINIVTDFSSVKSVFTNNADSYTNENSNVVLNALGGNDTVLNFADDVIMFGGKDEDILFNSAKNVTVYSGAGDDTVEVNSASQNVSISGGSGNDSISNSADDAVIYGSYGEDTIINFGKNVTISGGYGNDILQGSSYADIFFGNSGNDYISGDEGDDTLYGGYDNDTLIGDAGSDYLMGGAGDDSINGGADDDTLKGGVGNDTLTGGAGSDLFIYISGNEVITDYEAEDKITISRSYTSEISGDDVIFTTKKGTLTVKNGADKNITVNDSVQSFSANISELVENKLVGDFENYKFDYKQENLITYTDK